MSLSESGSSTMDSSMNNSTDQKLSKADAMIASLNGASELRGQYAVSQIGEFGNPEDEIEAVSWLLRIASSKCTQKFLIKGELPSAAPFVTNDAIQSLSECTLTQLKGSMPWDKRQSLLRSFMSQERTDLSLALLRQETDALTAAGYERMGEDPLGLTFVNENDGIMLHMWRSPSHARRWTTKTQRCAQALFECRLQPLAAPISILTSTRATAFTFSCLFPIPSYAPLEGDSTADALSSSLSSIMGFIPKSFDEEISLDNMDAPLKATPAVSVTASEACVVAGMDGRYYCLNPDLFGLNLITAVQGSRAVDHSDDALQHIAPDAMHLCYPKGVTGEGAPNMKSVAHAISTSGVHHAVQAIVARADVVAKAATGGVKIQDFMMAEVITSPMKTSGLNKCYLYAVWAAIKTHNSAHSAMLCEIIESEILFRVMKSIYRAEVLVSHDKSDTAIMRIFNRAFSAMNSADAQVWNVLNSVARKKFKAPQNFVLAHSGKLCKLVLWYMAPRLGVTFDQAAGKFNKMSFVSPYSGTLALPDLIKMQQKQPELCKSHHGAPLNIWARMPETPHSQVEKALRMVRLAVLGFFTRSLTPTEALDALAPVLSAVLKSGTIPTPYSVVSWDIAQLHDFATHAAVKAAATIVEKTAPTTSDVTSITDPAVGQRWRADSQHSTVGNCAFLLNVAGRGANGVAWSIGAVPDSVGVAVESLVQSGGEAGLQFATYCAIVLTKAAEGIQYLSAPHAWLLRRARKICSEAVTADDSALRNAATGWMCAAAGITAQPRPSLLHMVINHVLQPALTETVRRRLPHDEDDVESVLALVRYLVAVCVLKKSKHKSFMALLEYASFINDSVQLQSHTVTPKSTVSTWSQVWQAKDVDDLRETTGSKMFATSLGNLCIEVLRPDWAIISTTVDVVKSNPVSIPDGMQNAKMMEAAARLDQANRAATKIASLMRFVVRRAGCQLSADIVTKWTQASSSDEAEARLCAWNFKSIQLATTLYAFGIQEMQSMRVLPIVVDFMDCAETSTRQEIVNQEDGDRTRIVATASSGMLEQSMASLLLTEELQRSDIMIDECIQAASFYHAHATSVIDIETQCFTLSINSAAALEHLVADEIQARCLLEVDYIDSLVHMAFTSEWELWLRPLEREHASLTTGAAFAEFLATEVAARRAVEIAALLDLLPTPALEESDEFTLDDDVEAPNDFDEAWFHSSYCAVATASLQALIKRAFDSAAFYVFSVSELDERDVIENEYWNACADVTSDDYEAVMRHVIWEDKRNELSGLLADVFVAEHSLFGDASFQQLVALHNEANSAAVEAAMNQTISDETDARDGVLRREEEACAALLLDMETIYRDAIVALYDTLLGDVVAEEQVDRLVLIPEALAREKRFRTATAIFSKVTQELAILHISDTWQAQCQEVVEAFVEGEALLRTGCQSEAHREVTQLVFNGFDSWVYQSLHEQFLQSHVETAELMYAERKWVDFAASQDDIRDAFCTFAEEAAALYRSESEGELSRFRLAQFNDQLQCAMTEIATSIEPEHRYAIVVEQTKERAAIMLVARQEYGVSLFTNYCEAVLCPLLVSLETNLRRSIEAQSLKTFWIGLVQDVEQSERAVLAALVAKQRSILKKQRALIADEMTQRLAMEAQVEKMYENSTKVMYLLVRAMTAGPRATLMPPSERQLMQRREEHRVAATNDATPSPQKVVQNLGKELPIQAVVLQDPTLLQQAALLESMFAMKLDQELQVATVECEELHQRWQLGSLTDHVMLPDGDSPKLAPPRMTAEAFSNAVTSLFAKEMWRRQQIIQIHFDFLSSCRIEFKEIDTLMRGEKRVLPRSTLILDLPCVSPLFFTCFVELAQRMTKPKEKDVTKTVQRRMAARRKLLPEVMPRSRSMSVVSSTASTHLTFSGFGYGFDESVRCITKMKKIMVTCDRGVTAIYEEENKNWVKLLATEKHHVLTMQESHTLASSARKRFADPPPALSYDPTSARNLDLPQGPLSGRAPYFVSPSAVALTEAEHRLKVAMAEAEHRFELLRRLNSERPVVSTQKSIFSPDAPIPFYLNERHLVKVARARQRPIPLEMSPPRNLSGSPLAGAGGYSFYASAEHSHSPERAPRPRPGGPLSPIRRRTESVTPLSRSADLLLSPGHLPDRPRVGSLPALNVSSPHA